MTSGPVTTAGWNGVTPCRGSARIRPTSGHDRSAPGGGAPGATRSGAGAPDQLERVGHAVPRRGATAPDDAGATTRRSSSTRPAASSACVSTMPPWTPMSPPSPARSSRTKSSTGPLDAFGVGPPAGQGRRDATYFCTVLMPVGERLVVGPRPMVRPRVVHPPRPAGRCPGAPITSPRLASISARRSRGRIALGSLRHTVDRHQGVPHDLAHASRLSAARDRAGRPS